MHTRFLTLLCCTGLFTPLLPGVAQTSTSCGWVRQNAAAQGDTRIGPALEREPLWETRLTGHDANTLYCESLPGDFGAQPCYARILTGELAGRVYAITGHTAETLQLASTPHGLEPGAAIAITPYWTLGTLYPPEAVGVAFAASASSLVRQTELLMYDPAAVGTNPAPVATYYFHNGAWRKLGASATTSFNDTPLPPGTTLVQRNKALATALIYCGTVAEGPQAMLVAGRAGTRQDYPLTLPYPVPVTLRESGLVESGGFTPSASSLVRGDELLLFDPSQTGPNPAPTATYYYLNGGWRRLGASLATDFSDTTTLPAGGGFILRKAASAPAHVWTFLP